MHSIKTKIKIPHHPNPLSSHFNRFTTTTANYQSQKQPEKPPLPQQQQQQQQQQQNYQQQYQQQQYYQHQQYNQQQYPHQQQPYQYQPQPQYQNQPQHHQYQQHPHHYQQLQQQQQPNQPHYQHQQPNQQPYHSPHPSPAYPNQRTQSTATNQPNENQHANRMPLFKTGSNQTQQGNRMKLFKTGSDQTRQGNRMSLFTKEPYRTEPFFRTRPDQIQQDDLFYHRWIKDKSDPPGKSAEKNSKSNNLQVIKKRKDEAKKLRRLGIVPSYGKTSKSKDDPDEDPSIDYPLLYVKQQLAQKNWAHEAALKPKKTPPLKVKKELAIPSAITVSQLAQLTRQKLYRLQSLMQSAGLLDTRPDRILSTDDTAYLVLESGFEPIVNDGLAYDVYPDPVDPNNRSSLPLRPPVVCIMGHVDHGKTTLLDSLRKSSVAESEAGGITQHIGAFEVSLEDLMKNNTNHSKINDPDDEAGGPKTITFLDTPGHAAFRAMRSRGAMTTDVAVIVVAGDDGVKPQTKEVIKLVKQTDIGIVIAITKCDKPGIDLHRTKAGIYEAGIEIEGLGGEVPCVEVSAVTRKGLAELAETILAVAEVRDLRAEADGVRFEGRVIESDIERGHGNVASVITLRGNLHVGMDIIAGRSYGRVRQLISVSGETLQSISPGRPVRVTGWKNLPEAGSLVLGVESEEQAKRAYENRVRRFEEIDLADQIEAVNEKRAQAKEAFETNKSEVKGMTRRERLAHLREKNQKELAQAKANETNNESSRRLRVVLKADFTGTVEAVKAAIESLGNDEVKVQIISSGVGNITESDVQMAIASNASIVGFNIKIDPMAHSPIEKHKIPCLIESVIYRLVDQTTEKLIDLLPKKFKPRVIGEAKILQIFEVNSSFGGGNKSSKSKVAGSKVLNGEIKKNCLVKILRNKQVIWSGLIKDLKQGRKETNSVTKGTEFGISFKENPAQVEEQSDGLVAERDAKSHLEPAASEGTSPSTTASFEKFEVDDLIIASDLVPVQRSLTDGL